jgi:hypothetical protein
MDSYDGDRRYLTRSGRPRSSRYPKSLVVWKTHLFSKRVGALLSYNVLPDQDPPYVRNHYPQAFD